MREVCPHANRGRPSVSPRPCSIFRRGLKHSFSSPTLAAITKPSGLRCPLECIAREGSPTQVRKAVARRAPRPCRSTPHGQKGDPIERRPARSLASSQPLPKKAPRVKRSFPLRHWHGHRNIVDLRTIAVVRSHLAAIERPLIPFENVIIFHGALRLAINTQRILSRSHGGLAEGRDTHVRVDVCGASRIEEGAREDVGAVTARLVVPAGVCEALRLRRMSDTLHQRLARGDSVLMVNPNHVAPHAVPEARALGCRLGVHRARPGQLRGHPPHAKAARYVGGFGPPPFSA